MYQRKDISIKDLKAYAVHSTNHTYIEWWDPKIKKIVHLYEPGLIYFSSENIIQEKKK